MPTTSRFYNASFINEYGKLEILRTERYGNNFSVISLEVDDAVGSNYKDDELIYVLRQMVKVITSTLRECDLLGMINHNRFTILLPETDIFGSIITIRRIKRVLKNSDLTKNLIVHLGSASYPNDGKDFDVLLGKAKSKIDEYKESLFVRLALENKDFWTIVDTLVANNGENDQNSTETIEETSETSQKISSVSSSFFDVLQKMILKEILNGPKVSGILYMPFLKQTMSSHLLQELHGIDTLRTKIFFITGDEETEKIPGIGYIELNDKQILNTPFVLFFRRDLAYCILCRKKKNGNYEAFHTIDEVLIEALINKFQEKYLLQEQL